MFLSPTPPLPLPSLPSQVVGLAALSCGLVCIGSCHDSLTEALLQIMIDKEVEGLSNSHMRFVALGLALLYLGEALAPACLTCLRQSSDGHVMVM